MLSYYFETVNPSNFFYVGLCVGIALCYLVLARQKNARKSRKIQNVLPGSIPDLTSTHQVTSAHLHMAQQLLSQSAHVQANPIQAIENAVAKVKNIHDHTSHQFNHLAHKLKIDPASFNAYFANRDLAFHLDAIDSSIKELSKVNSKLKSKQIIGPTKIPFACLDVINTLLPLIHQTKLAANFVALGQNPLFMDIDTVDDLSTKAQIFGDIQEISDALVSLYTCIALPIVDRLQHQKVPEAIINHAFSEPQSSFIKLQAKTTQTTFTLQFFVQGHNKTGLFETPSSQTPALFSRWSEIATQGMLDLIKLQSQFSMEFHHYQHEGKWLYCLAFPLHIDIPENIKIKRPTQTVAPGSHDLINTLSEDLQIKGSTSKKNLTLH